MEERLVSPSPKEEDREVESSLRPRRLADYVGQGRIKERLKIYIEAARGREEPLDHVLLYGPPGLGKTTLAHIISNEMGSAIRTTSGPAIERPGDMVAILTNLDDRGVLFIDEIHRLNHTAEEALYPAMEDFLYDWVAGKGPSARTYRVKLPRFTLIGATTRAGLLASPLRDRFGITLRLEFYEPAELECILDRSAGILGVAVDREGLREIALRSRGTPRVANRLLRRLRDFAQVRGRGVIDGDTAREGLRLLEVDEVGLDRVDREMLRSIITRYAGGPVGLETVAASISEEPETIEDVYEPYLLQIGFIQRTPRGRMVTAGAYDHLGLRPPQADSSQQKFW
ncbi:MAG: Holliday junction branch migration DNA helicase RuvB [Firmicutes bacterium]|nr:Holliday junction branch migration DNA helicase RuvB [Bacillota bacterium]